MPALDNLAVSINPEGRGPFKNNNLGKLLPEECEDITGRLRQLRARGRPADAFSTWRRHVEIAFATDELRRAGRTYKDAVASVAKERHASKITVKRAYALYIREPTDPNSAENRRKWQNKV